MVQTGREAPAPYRERAWRVRLLRIVPHSVCSWLDHLCGERVHQAMCGNNSGLWIIIVLILLFSCGGFGYGCGGSCGCGCGCENNCGCNCNCGC
jgi:hypothetical protein